MSNTGNDESNNSEKRSLQLWVSHFIFALSLLFVAALIWNNPDVLSDHRFVLPILIGMIAFPSLIFTIVYCFKALSASGMVSKYHAFGLPPGSIRAILAMGFIVLVLVFGIYLITEVSSPQRRVLVDTEVVKAGDFRPKGQSADDKNETDAAYKERISNAEQAVSKGQESLREAYGQGFVVKSNIEDGFTELNVYRLDNGERVATLAQQILTMLATALTAIVGFYFGSRTANEPEQSNSINSKEHEELRQAKEKLASLITIARQSIVNIQPSFQSFKDSAEGGDVKPELIKRIDQRIARDSAELDNMEYLASGWGVGSAELREALGRCDSISKRFTELKELLLRARESDSDALKDEIEGFLDKAN
ncbi:hypothetical protein [Ruegeria hyattellae]|uniref:hypothetical protein n=1 Tax=Ruegeria hyattellae TaxID=3233337 RepID=UPI00355C2CE7